jgi:hypothetical protein
LPRTGEPEIVGAVVLTGTADVISGVGFDVATVEPSEFVATTCARILKPASAARRTYVALSAFEMRPQSEAFGCPRPSQRYQRYVKRI